MGGIFFVLMTANLTQPCPECRAAENFATITNPAEIQRAGINRAVEELEKQVLTLSEIAGQEPRLVATHPDKDQQTAVMNLADAMENNGLLTRAYLALAVAELKLITLPCTAGCCPEAGKRKYLRHAEAIVLATDDKSLDAQDLRVLRVLTAGVNEALREELIQLQSSPQLMFTTQVCFNRRRCSNCRLKQNLRNLTCRSNCR